MSRSDDIDERRRRLLHAVAAGGTGVALAGCQGLTGDPTETPGGNTTDDTDTDTGAAMQPQGPGDREFIAGTTSGAQSLNPINISDEATTNRLVLFYDGGSVSTQPGDIDSEVQFEGRWLSGYDIDDDFRTVTYEIREGLQWGADYGELVADDYIEFLNTIVYGDLDRDQNPVGYTQTSSYVLGGERIEIERLGKYEFRTTLPQPRRYWLAEDPLRGAYILPQGLIEKYKPVQFREIDGNQANVVSQVGRDEAVVEAELSGNLGPFDFESWEKGQKLVVSADEDYYLADTDVRDGAFRDSPAVDSYTFQVFDSQSTGYSAVRAGDITTIGVEGRKVEELRTEGTEIWESTYDSGIFYLNLNHRVNGWAPIRESTEVRQAFAHLIDKNTLIDQIFEGHAQPLSTFHPEWGPFYPDELPTFEPSVEQARQKIASGTGSDYTYDGDQLIGPDGEQVELTVVTVNTSQTGEIIANYLKQRLGQAGIATTIEGDSFTNLLRNYLAPSVANNPNYSGEPDYNAGFYNGGPPDQAIGKNPWDILYGVGFDAGAFTPWQVLKLVLAEQGQFNFIGYTTDEVDILERSNAAATADSAEETRRILGELFAFLAEDQPLTWLFNDNTIAVYRQLVEGLPEPENFYAKPNDRLLGLQSG
jgi:peptide/nickel transport system substrate-binding protein